MNVCTSSGSWGNKQNKVRTQLWDTLYIRHTCELFSWSYGGSWCPKEDWRRYPISASALASGEDSRIFYLFYLSQGYYGTTRLKSTVGDVVIRNETLVLSISQPRMHQISVPFIKRRSWQFQKPPTCWIRLIWSQLWRGSHKKKNVPQKFESWNFGCHLVFFYVFITDIH